MKFALVNGEKVEATKGVKGICRQCGSELISRCGDERINHWAHKRSNECDIWWENETEWHRKWKDKFPVDWQEILHLAADGERHIADVKTYDGWVIEFQHSVISPEERQSRETFYQSLIWVVDGIRRKKDAAQFFREWSKGQSPNPFSTKRRFSSPSGALFRDWGGTNSHVFFDFGDQKWIWWLFPESDDIRAYVQAVSREQFVRIHRERSTHGTGEFDSLVENFSAFVATYEVPPLTPRPSKPVAIQRGANLMKPIRRSFRL